jgi:hypothetical protein
VAAMAEVAMATAEAAMATAEAAMATVEVATATVEAAMVEVAMEEMQQQPADTCPRMHVNGTIVRLKRNSDSPKRSCTFPTT